LGAIVAPYLHLTERAADRELPEVALDERQERARSPRLSQCAMREHSDSAARARARRAVAVIALLSAVLIGAAATAKKRSRHGPLSRRALLTNDSRVVGKLSLCRLTTRGTSRTKDGIAAAPVEHPIGRSRDHRLIPNHSVSELLGALF
jgi:hypothetical protein